MYAGFWRMRTDDGCSSCGCDWEGRTKDCALVCESEHVCVGESMVGMCVVGNRASFSCVGCVCVSWMICLGENCCADARCFIRVAVGWHMFASV